MGSSCSISTYSVDCSTAGEDFLSTPEEQRLSLTIVLCCGTVELAVFYLTLHFLLMLIPPPRLDVELKHDLCGCIWKAAARSSSE